MERDDEKTSSASGGNDHAEQQIVRMWTFATLFGAWRVGKGDKRACPVCGGDSNCQVSAEGAVLCRRIASKASGGGRGERRQGAAGTIGVGIEFIATDAQGGGRVWAPMVGGKLLEPPEISGAELSRRGRLEGLVKEAKRRIAWRDYLLACGGNHQSSVGCGHELVDKYLRGRGIDVDALPGKVVPRALRFWEGAAEYYEFDGRDEDGTPREALLLEDLEGEGKIRDITQWTPVKVHSPGAMVAMVIDLTLRNQEEDDKAIAAGLPPEYFRGLHMTYLERRGGMVVKRDGGRGRPPRRERGPCDGVIVFPAAGATTQDPYPEGVKIDGEGIETTLTVHSALAGQFTCWVATCSRELKRLKLPTAAWTGEAKMGESGKLIGALHTCLTLVDVDKLERVVKSADGERGVVSRTGQRAAAEIARQTMSDCPGLSVRPVWPDAEKFPTLVRRVRLEGIVAELAARGELGCCAFADSTGAWLEDQPFDQRKGIDWNDAGKVDGLVGLQRVGDQLAAFIDRYRAEDARRWMESGPERRAVAEAMGQAEAERNGAKVVMGESGLALADDGVHVGAREDEDFGVLYRDEEWTKNAGEDDEFMIQRHLRLPKSELARARSYLLSEHAPEIDLRPGGGMRLVHLNGDFSRFDGRVWTPMRSKQEVGAVRGDLACFIEPRYERVMVKEQWQVRKCNSGDRNVQAVAKRVVDQVQVQCDRSRFWMRPWFGATGRAMWSVKPWERALTDEEAARRGLPAPDDLTIAQNCMLDTRAMKAGEVRTLPHTPLLYNTQALPFDLPVAELERVCRGGDKAWEKLIAKKCPTIMQFLSRIFLREHGDNQASADQAIEQIIMLTGLYLTHSMRYKRANLVIIQGGPDSGKGTLAELWQATIGPWNVVWTSIDEMADKNHLSSWSGKSLAIIDEGGDTGKQADVPKAKQVMKRVSGGGYMSLRDLYQLERQERLSSRMLMLCNDSPDWQDDSGAMSKSRGLWFELKYSATGQQDFDSTLKERVVAEASGWMLAGLWGLTKIGARERDRQPVFVQPDQGKASALMHEQYAAGLSQYLKICVQLVGDDEFPCPLEHLYTVYCRFLERRGHKQIITMEKLGKRLRIPLLAMGWTGDVEENAVYVAASNQSPGQRGIAFKGIAITDNGWNLLTALAQSTGAAKPPLDVSVAKEVQMRLDPFAAGASPAPSSP